MKKNIEIHLVDLSTSLPLPYADEGIRAGFPSPAQDYMEQAIGDKFRISDSHFFIQGRCFYHSTKFLPACSSYEYLVPSEIFVWRLKINLITCI